jgi:cytochrome P450
MTASHGRPPKLPPGPRGLPLLGSLVPFQFSPLRFFRALQRDHGDLVMITVANRRVVFCFGPRQVRQVMVDAADQLVRPQLKVDAAANLRAFLGESMALLDGEAHLQARRQVQPAFHSQLFDAHAASITRFTLDMLESWPAGRSIDVVPPLQGLAMRIILKILFDQDSPQRAATVARWFADALNGVRASTGLGMLPLDLPFTTYGRFRASLGAIDSFVYALIEERVRAGAAGAKRDILSLLLAPDGKGNALTRKQMRDQLVTLLLAGHETVQTSVLWALYQGTQAPDAQRKLATELQRVLAGRPPAAADLARLPYLDAYVHEVLRLFPPVWRVAFEARSAITLDGYQIPAGTIVIACPWVTHVLPEAWTDPAVFRPERWEADERKRIIASGAYFPFSLGPHNCLGGRLAMSEIRLILATILQRVVPARSPRPVELQSGLNLYPKHGMPLVFEPPRPAP